MYVSILFRKKNNWQRKGNFKQTILSRLIPMATFNYKCICCLFLFLLWITCCCFVWESETHTSCYIMAKQQN